MTSQETSDDPNVPRITLSITGRNLPTETNDLESLLKRLEAAANVLLTETIGESEVDIESWIGQFYAAVEPVCPACGNRLDLQGIYLGKNEDAYSLAICTADCGWSGDATFSLIDLDRRVGGEDFEGSVLAGRVTVTYRPYMDRES